MASMELENDWDYNLAKYAPKMLIAPTTESLSNGINHSNATVRINESIGAFSCYQCSYTCDDKGNLQDHVGMHSFMKTLSCVYCSYKTLSEPHYTRHVSDHQIERAAMETRCTLPDLSKMYRYDDSANLDTVIAGDQMMQQQQELSLNGVLNGNGCKRNSNEFNEESINNPKRKKAKITDYFYPSSKETSSSGSVDKEQMLKSHGFFRCGYCKYKSKVKRQVLKHVENNHKSPTSQAGNNKTTDKSKNDSVKSNGIIPRNPSVTSLIKEEEEANESSQLSPIEVALEQYCKKNNTDTPKTILACPFCSVKSTSRLKHKKHIEIHHINSKSNGNVGEMHSSSVSDEHPSLRPFRADIITGTGHDSPQHEQLDFEGFTEDIEHTLKKLDHDDTTPPTNSKISKSKKGKPKKEIPEQCNVANIKLRSPRSVTTELNSTKNVTNNDYVCPLCHFRTFSRQQFEMHNTKHKSQTIFSCKRCTFATVAKKYLTDHQYTHFRVQGRVMFCPNCPFRTNQSKFFFCHLEKCDLSCEENGFDKNGCHTCPMCAFRSFDIDLFKTHMLTHVSNQTMLHCNICPFKTSRGIGLKAHMRLGHNTKTQKFPCDLCPFTTIRIIQLQNHLTKMHKTRRSLKELSNVVPFEEDSYTDTNALKIMDRLRSRSIEIPSIEQGKLKTAKQPMSFCDIFEKHLGVIQMKKGPTSVPTKKIYKRFVPPDGVAKQTKKNSSGSLGSVCPSKKSKKSSKPSAKKKSPAYATRAVAPESAVDSVERCASPDVILPGDPSSFSNPENIFSSVEDSWSFVTTPSDLQPPTHVCPFCSQSYSYVKELTKHVLIHANHGKLTCPVCNFSTMEFSKLKMHLKDIHEMLC